MSARFLELAGPSLDLERFVGGPLHHPFVGHHAQLVEEPLQRQRLRRMLLKEREAGLAQARDQDLPPVGVFVELHVGVQERAEGAQRRFSAAPVGVG